MSALRQKRQAIDGAATQDAWVQHVAEQSMLTVVDPDAGSQKPAWPKGAPVEAPAPYVDQRTEDNVSQDELNSQDAAFETWWSGQPWMRGSGGSGATGLHQVVHEAMARSRLAGRESPANGHEAPGGAD